MCVCACETESITPKHKRQNNRTIKNVSLMYRTVWRTQSSATVEDFNFDREFAQLFANLSS